MYVLFHKERRIGTLNSRHFLLKWLYRAKKMIDHVYLCWPITGFVTRVTRRVPYIEQELLTLPDHLGPFSFCHCFSFFHRYTASELPMWY